MGSSQDAWQEMERARSCANCTHWEFEGDRTVRNCKHYLCVRTIACEHWKQQEVKREKQD